MIKKLLKRDKSGNISKESYERARNDTNFREPDWMTNGNYIKPNDNPVHNAINIYLKGSGKNKGKKPDERYASFDYCYTYFYSFYTQNRISEIADDANLQMSCLQIGFFLASWGMMRGSSFLIEKSIRHYKNLIIAISKMDPKLWEIDVDSYDIENIKLLLNCKAEIIEALGKEFNPSDTLITKVMLGVFGNVPAFDKYFSGSFHVYKLNKKSLKIIRKFYEQNKTSIDLYKIPTFDFLTSNETDVIYTKAKLIDMCGFVEGKLLKPNNSLKMNLDIYSNPTK